jgi:uncharacterized protein YxeA
MSDKLERILKGKKGGQSINEVLSQDLPESAEEKLKP